MKKVVSILSLLLAINFASAAEIGDLLGSIDQSLVILIALFLVTFSLSFFALNKVFKDNKTMAGVVAGAVAFLAVYGVNKIEFDTGNLLSSLGMSESVISLALFVIITAGIIFMFVKLKRNALMILGILLVGLSFFVYAKALLMIAGIILLIIWVVLNVKKKGNKLSFQNVGAGI
jgi:hypothetical protein